MRSPILKLFHLLHISGTFRSSGNFEFATLSERTCQPIQNIRCSFNFVERNPFIDGVGLGDVAGAKDDGGDAGVAQGGRIGAIGDGVDTVAAALRVNGGAEQALGFPPIPAGSTRAGKSTAALISTGKSMPARSRKNAK